ncbi:SDR family NAD(P)-dependent oxidoreductase [Prauserella endophytica]|uniref:SDR family NAD(P)-dependent oxidoreductase n=1 Tax=Prauserella endophytica TaxID=1592324 RepID=UPI0019801CED|nr:SDR family NAD(P)-dependent oxidoreductase [Prauserella endophytica]
MAGASRGIGRTVALALAEAGAAVAVAARSEREGKVLGTIHDVAGRITASGGRALAVPCDVTNEEAVESAVAATVAEFGGIDVLIANAGVLWLGPVESTPLRRWQLCLDVNLTGVFLVTRAVIPHVRARGGGSLVAVTTTGVGMSRRRRWPARPCCWPGRTPPSSRARCSGQRRFRAEAGGAGPRGEFRRLPAQL